MALDANKRVAVEYFDAFNARDFGRRHALIATNYLFHGVMAEPMSAEDHARFERRVAICGILNVERTAVGRRTETLIRRRLRKKRRLGEFREFGFDVSASAVRRLSDQPLGGR